VLVGLPFIILGVLTFVVSVLVYWKTRRIKTILTREPHIMKLSTKGTGNLESIEEEAEKVAHEKLEGNPPKPEQVMIKNR
jgi:hypothetical protein